MPAPHPGRRLIPAGASSRAGAATCCRDQPRWHANVVTGGPTCSPARANRAGRTVRAHPPPDGSGRSPAEPIIRRPGRPEPVLLQASRRARPSPRGLAPGRPNRAGFGPRFAPAGLGAARCGHKRAWRRRPSTNRPLYRPPRTATVAPAAPAAHQDRRPPLPPLTTFAARRARRRARRPPCPSISSPHSTAGPPAGSRRPFSSCLAAIGARLARSGPETVQSGRFQSPPHVGGAGRREVWTETDPRSVSDPTARPSCLRTVLPADCRTRRALPFSGRPSLAALLRPPFSGRRPSTPGPSRRVTAAVFVHASRQIGARLARSGPGAVQSGRFWSTPRARRGRAPRSVDRNGT